MTLRHRVPLLIGQLAERISPKWNAALWRYLRLAKPIQIWRSQGKTRSGASGVLISSGIEPQADYFPGLFFEKEFEVQSLGHVSPRHLEKRIKEWEHSADLVALRLDRIQAALLFNRSYIRVPEWVRSAINVPSQIEQLATGHNSLRQDLRLVRKYGYSVAASHDTEIFEAFYQCAYLPHGRGRHGPHAHLRSRNNLFESFKRGVLLIINKDGQMAAGLVLEHTPEGISFAGIGVSGGDEQLLKMGALAAAYFFGLSYAREKQIAKVDLGGTRPCCADSLLKYKRKWGAAIEAKPLHTNDYIMRWRSTNSSVSALLQKFPLIVRDQDRLSALTVPGAESVTLDLPQGLTRKIEVEPFAPYRWPIET